MLQFDALYFLSSPAVPFGFILIRRAVLCAATAVSVAVPGVFCLHRGRDRIVFMCRGRMLSLLHIRFTDLMLWASDATSHGPHRQACRSKNSLAVNQRDGPEKAFCSWVAKALLAICLACLPLRQAGLAVGKGQSSPSTS